MTSSIDHVGARFASTPNAGDLETGTGVGVAIAQASEYQVAANTDTGPKYEVAKGDKLSQIIKDLKLKTVTPGTDGAVFAMEKLDARQRQLQDQLNAGQEKANSSLANLQSIGKEIQKAASYSVEEELSKVTWTPMPIQDPPRPVGQTIKPFMRAARILPPSAEQVAQWEADVTKHREFVTDVNRKRLEEARENRRKELEKTPDYERRANEVRTAVQAIKKSIGDSNINEKELTGIITTVRGELAGAREQQMLMEQDFNSVSAYAMDLRDAIKELEDEIAVTPEKDPELPAKKFLMSELMTRKRTIAAIGRDLKGGLANNVKNIEKTEQRIAMSDTLLNNLGKVVGSVQQLVEDMEGMLLTYGADNRVMLATETMLKIRDLAQELGTKFEDLHMEKFAALMNAQPERDFQFAKKEGERSTKARGTVDPILELQRQSDDDTFGMLTGTGYDGPTSKIGSGTGIDSAIRNGLNSEELFVPQQERQPSPPQS